MTLIVGIRCSGGVVVGSDSAITFVADTQTPTIQQRSSAKIEVIDDSLIVAGTGALGMGQRFTDITRKLSQSQQHDTAKSLDIGRALSAAALQDFASTNAPARSYGALVAIPCAGSAELIEFSVDGFQPEVKTDDSWYVSMGAGQVVADPLLGFFRTVFWGDQPPNLQDGVFALTMVLQLGCEMAPIGVARPLQIAVLGPDHEGNLSARRLNDDELLEHEENVSSAMAHFRRYRDTSGATAGATVTLPISPSV